MNLSLESFAPPPEIASAIPPTAAGASFAANASGTPLAAPAPVSSFRAAHRAYWPAYLLAAATVALAAGLLLASPAAPAVPAPPPAAAPALAAPLPAVAAPLEPPAEARAVSPRRPPTAPPQPAAAAPAPRLRLTTPEPEIDGELLDAHRLLETQDLAGARQAYERVLRRRPQDTGSLLALAAIAGFTGDDEAAATLHRRAYEADPSDPAVLAALLAANTVGEPRLAESRLRSLLASQAAPSLEFALANLLARQRRWAEAQQAYFRAVAGDADNPDYLFNLAVSLDQLRQPRLAASYYRQALAAAASRAAAFDRPQAEQRAATLADAGQP